MTINDLLEKERDKVLVLDKDHILWRGCQYISLRRFNEVKYGEKREDKPKKEDFAMSHKTNIRAILECHFAGFKDEIIDSACERILEQESEKIGHWISEDGEYNIACPECGQYWSCDGHAKIFKRCFNCGSRMVPLKESEDKE